MSAFLSPLAPPPAVSAASASGWHVSALRLWNQGTLLDHDLLQLAAQAECVLRLTDDREPDPTGQSSLDRVRSLLLRLRDEVPHALAEARTLAAVGKNAFAAAELGCLRQSPQRP